MQEGFYLLHDCFSFTFWANDSQHKIIRIPAVSQPAVAWIVVIRAWHLQHTPVQFPLGFHKLFPFLWALCLLDFGIQRIGPICNGVILRISASSLSFGILRDERFHEAVK